MGRDMSNILMGLRNQAFYNAWNCGPLNAIGEAPLGGILPIDLLSEHEGLSALWEEMPQ